jgi:GxxExxY protein
MEANVDVRPVGDVDQLTKAVIGCAYEVGNELGCGFLESVYEVSLVVELEEAGLAVERQKTFDVRYKRLTVGHYIADLVVENRLIVEVKALSAFSREHHAQLLNYLKATGLKVGLLLNFGQPRVQVKRLVREY